MALVRVQIARSSPDSIAQVRLCPVQTLRALPHVKLQIARSKFGSN